MKKVNVVIATIKPWNIKNSEFFKKKYKHEYNITIITQKEDLSCDLLRDLKPKYIFFPHWSWIIPEKIFENFECIVFHMTDLPYGRGGSPLQNLISNKIYKTKISAIRVEKGLDTGEIYLKEDFHIGIGSAEEIFIKMSEVIFFKMIPSILSEKPTTYKQVGEVTEFKRRKPEQSNILGENFIKLDDFYDFVRMLDADGYPKAYIDLGSFKLIFSNVHQKSDKLFGNFEVIKNVKE